MTSTEPGILIFGGTFDPPHLAHASLPPIAADRLGCDRIIFVPAAINPLKTDTPPTPAPHRLAMLHLAVRDIANAEIDTLELDRSGLSFTVDTLETMRERFGPSRRLHLLIGADAALSFERWKDWQQILELAEPAIMPRPPWPRAALMEEFRRVHSADRAAYWIDRLVEVPFVDIGATEVRSRLSAAGDLEGMLDPGVIDYISAHGLYDAPQRSA